MDATLSFGEVLALVEDRSPRLQAARTLVEAAATRESAAGLLPDPMLQIGVMNLSLPDLSATMPASMAPVIQAMQRIPLPGKLALRGRIAAQSTAMWEAGAQEEWWRVRTEAATAFYRLYALDRQIGVMEETLALLRDFGTVAKAMYSAGTGRQADVLRADVEVARMAGEIQRMVALRQGAAARLNALVDRRGDHPVPTPQLDPLPLLDLSADTLRAWANDSRPLLERSRVGVERATSRKALADKEIWPDFTVGVHYGQRKMEGDYRSMGGASVGFSIPVFAGRRQLKAREEARAVERVARAELREARAVVEAQLAAVVAELGQAETLIQLYRDEIIPQARATVESSLSSYRVGAVDFMTLVDAEMALNRFEGELFDLLADYGTALARLEMTIGRTLPQSGRMLSEEQ
jgi:outer membrane protein TolC